MQTNRKEGIREMQTKGVHTMQTIMQRKTDHPVGRALLVLIAALAAALMMNVAAGRASAHEATTEQTTEQTGDSSVLEELPPATPAKDTRHLLSQGRTYWQYVSAVKQNIDYFWARRFASAGRPYRYANLRYVYTSANTPCGPWYSSKGPMYCGTRYDQAVYWTPYYTDRYGYRMDQYGDFAMAYMMGHEMGHHVQFWAGIRLAAPYFELQADCLSGVWANSQYHARYLQAGDLQEALRMASRWPSQIHGTGTQRYNAFWRGYYYGNPYYCSPNTGLRSAAPTEDNAKPEITGLRPASKTSDRTPAVRAVVRDASGELAKNHVKLYLDGRQVSTASYNQETGKLRYVSGKLDFGKHTVKVVATDLGQNTATETWSFKVAR